jgi:radical SAM protein with 4Fe4S-binding SPASM domain
MDFWQKIADKKNNPRSWLYNLWEMLVSSILKLLALLRKALTATSDSSYDSPQRHLTQAAAIDVRYVDEFKKGITTRNYCIHLINSILDSIERQCQEVTGVAKENIIAIKRNLTSFGDLNQYLNLSVEQEVASFHINNSTLSHEPDAILATLESWRKSLVEKQMLLVRLQRYVTVIALKLPKQYAQAPLPTYSPDEVARARELNQEILAYEVLLGKNVVTSTPPNIQIEPTNRCNARCKPCPHASPVGKTYSDFNVDSLHKIPHVLSVAQFVEFLGLGEPTIASSFGHLATLCQNQGCETHVITNGTKLLQNEDLRRMKKIGISWDGDSKETFEAIRVGINFDSVVNSVRIFQNQNPEIFLYFACTINRANIFQIPGMAKIAKDLRLNAITFHLMSPGNQAMKSAVLKMEDIPIYREKIEEAQTVLQDSSVQLFDYGIVERLAAQQELLDPEASLVQIKSYTPLKEQHNQSIVTTIKEFYQKRFELYPVHHNISFFSAKAITPPAPKIASKKLEVFEIINRSIPSLEKRALDLKTEVLAIGAKGLNIPHCTAAWSRLIVKADGRMFPCCSWSNTYANLKEVTNFNTSWNGEFHQNLRDSFTGSKPLNKKCQHCISSDKYQGLPEILRVIKGLDLAYDEIPKQPGFKPPSGKLKL